MQEATFKHIEICRKFKKILLLELLILIMNALLKFLNYPLTILPLYIQFILV